MPETASNALVIHTSNSLVGVACTAGTTEPNVRSQFAMKWENFLNENNLPLDLWLGSVNTECAPEISLCTAKG